MEALVEGEAKDGILEILLVLEVPTNLGPKNLSVIVNPLIIITIFTPTTNITPRLIIQPKPPETLSIDLRTRKRQIPLIIQLLVVIFVAI